MEISESQEKKTKDTQATPAMKGYILQNYFGIYFFFYNANYRNIKSIKSEGVKEDIEIIYRDNSQDYIQVKTIEKVAEKVAFQINPYKKAMETLNTAYNGAITDGIQVKRLIYANNMINQGIERITNKIKNGTLENYILPFSNFTLEEGDKLKKHLKLDKVADFYNKLYFSRIDEHFFLEPERMLVELSDSFDRMKIKENRGIIFTSLKELFSENALSRNKKILVKDVAWLFIKRNLKVENIFKKFNELFSEEIEEIIQDDFEEFLLEADLIEMIEINSNYIDIYQHFERIRLKFEFENGKIKKSNQKKFLELKVEEFIKEDYLNLNLKNDYKNKEKKLIYSFLLFFIYKKKNDNEMIYNEFNLLGG